MASQDLGEAARLTSIAGYSTLMESSIATIGSSAGHSCKHQTGYVAEGAAEEGIEMEMRSWEDAAGNKVGKARCDNCFMDQRGVGRPLSHPSLELTASVTLLSSAMMEIDGAGIPRGRGAHFCLVPPGCRGYYWIAIEHAIEWARNGHLTRHSAKSNLLF